MATTRMPSHFPGRCTERNGVTFNMRLRLRVSDAKGIFANILKMGMFARMEWYERLMT